MPHPDFACPTEHSHRDRFKIERQAPSRQKTSLNRVLRKGMHANDAMIADKNKNLFKKHGPIMSRENTEVVGLTLERGLEHVWMIKRSTKWMALCNLEEW